MSCVNEKKCPCTYPCDNHGKCCECVNYHKDRGEVPACFFSKEAERTYDRSIKKLAEDKLKK